MTARPSGATTRAACGNCQQESWHGQAEPELEDNRMQIIDPHTAYQMTSILEGVTVRGTASTLRSIGKPVAGKTGTTNDSKDAWFVGYSPDLVVGVFVGYDSPRPMGKEATGGAVAVPIFGSFMKLALADKPATPFRIPPGIKLIRVNPSTGLRAQAGDAKSVLEAFKPDEEPDDPQSIIGFTDETGGFAPQHRSGRPAAARRRCPRPHHPPRLVLGSLFRVALPSRRVRPLEAFPSPRTHRVRDVDISRRPHVPTGDPALPDHAFLAGPVEAAIERAVQASNMALISVVGDHQRRAQRDRVAADGAADQALLLRRSAPTLAPTP